jgi:hypothetical protein
MKNMKVLKNILGKELKTLAPKEKSGIAMVYELHLRFNTNEVTKSTC